MCHHGFMYEGRDKNTNSQTNDSIKYISNTHGGDLLQLVNMYILEYVLENLEYLIDARGHGINNYNH